MNPSSRQKRRRRADKELFWADALQSAVEDLFAESALPGRTVPRIMVLAGSRSGTRFEFELRFVAGQSYCCAEPGCFVPATDRRWWNRLREKLAACSDRTPPPMTLTIHGVVENGVTLEVLNAAGMAQTSNYTYKWGPLREQDAR